MKRLLTFLMIMFCVNLLVGRATAHEQLSFYRMLLSTEQTALEAIRRRSVNDLLNIHNDAMYHTLGEGRGRWKPGPFCDPAFMQLSIAMLAYASAIDPMRPWPGHSAAEYAHAGDRMWREYLETVAECEKAIGVSNPPDRVLRPSTLLHRLLPALPGQK